MAGSRTTSIKITGNPTEAIAALDRLGIRAEEVGKQTEHALGGAAQRTGGLFQTLGSQAAAWGLPFGNVLNSIGSKFDETNTKGKKFGGALAEVGKAAFLGVGAGLAVAGGEALKLGMNFEEATTKLVTGAGESEDNLKKVRDGLIKMAPAVGMGPTALANAMFLVESAGYHGADGLNVMKAAAEGAKIGGADATVVANGLTTALTDYHLPASQAAQVTSQLVATVAAGKTNMQDLSSSLSAVLPSAAAAHIGLAQVLGALGTMTGEGISAQQASQNLAGTISALQNPSDVASKAMAQMGLNSTEVAQHLGQRGLTGTLDLLTQHILSHMGPAGLVLQSSFNQSKLAAQSANEMLHQLPPSLQKLGQGYLNGTVTQKQWTAALKGQPALAAALGKQFATTAKEAHGFSDTLKSGQGSAKTFNAMMAEMTGGQTGLNTALALTGKNSATFAGNVKTIGGAATEAGGHVKGWAETQKDLKTKLDQAKSGVEALGTKLGVALIPKVTEAINVISGIITWLGKHKDIAIALASVVGGVLVAAIGAWVIGLFSAEGAIGGMAVALAGADGPLGAFTVAMFGADASMLPMIVTVGLVVGAIAALAFGIYELVKHWKTVWTEIKKVTSEAVHAVVKFFKDLYHDTLGVFKDAGKWLENIGKDILHGLKNGLEAYLGLLLDFYVKLPMWILQKIGDATLWLLQKGKDVLKGMWNGITNGAVDVWNFFTGLPGKLADLIGDATKWLEHVGSDIIHGIVNGIENAAGDIGNALSGVLSHLPGASLLKKIPGVGSLFRAEGGPVEAGQPYIVGERGPELFMPSGGGTIIPNNVLMANSSSGQSNSNAPAAGAFQGGNQTTINNYLTAQTNATAESISRELAWSLRGYGGLAS